MYMSWEGLFSIVAVILALALYLSYLADKRPRGAQPATYRHLQTPVDLVDDWASDGKAMWWGDKGAHDEDSLKQSVRHSGTATTRLKPLSGKHFYF
jgi:hypothetical protein